MSSIESVRAQIELVDERLISVLAERVALAREAGRAKQAAGQPVIDPAREAAVVTRVSALARAAGLPDDDVRALYWRLMAMTRRVQLEE
jgi:chorismate mutase